MQLGDELDNKKCWPPAAPSARSFSASPVEGGLGQKRILVVDDEPAITCLLQEGLAEITNCEVIIASDGEEALQRFGDTSFDLLITDYNMPKMDGLTLVEQVRQLYPQVAVVILTAYGSDWLVQQALKLDIPYILRKPVGLLKLRRLVSELLGV